jgi:hypothetical protein
LSDHSPQSLLLAAFILCLQQRIPSQRPELYLLLRE